jgi:hypothetical protein
VGLAKYYMEKRAIPKKHLLQLRVSFHPETPAFEDAD